MQDPALLVEELRAQLASAHAAHQQILDEHALLKQAYESVRTELALLKQRLFVAKAERLDTTQLQLEFNTLFARAHELQRTMTSDAGSAESGAETGATNGGQGSRRGSKHKPSGRRDLRELPLPQERIEIEDSTAEGVWRRCGFEERVELRWRRASFALVTIARVKYETSDGIHTSPAPPSLIDRSMAGPSVWAATMSQKFLEGMPYHRQQDKLERAGVPLDRSLMSRWQETLGGTVGATVVEAARRYALSTAFAIATDATGVLVQPVASNDQVRQPCRRGHYFVQIADAEHVFFEYTPTENSQVVQTLFAGFKGHVIADAKSVYDVLYRAPMASTGTTDSVRKPDDSPEVCTEVACWSHARRKFWEAAVMTKDARAREGVARLMPLFDWERQWKKLPKAELAQRRRDISKPIVDDLLHWAEVQWLHVAHQRGLVRTAFGYLRNQADALQQYLDDARLPMTNNHAERELRRIAIGRNAWLFVGSDDHAQAAANLLSLIATARLHQIDPEQYLAELFFVLPQWPRDRYLELWPTFWPRTRERLDQEQLANQVGWTTIPTAPLSIP